MNERVIFLFDSEGEEFCRRMVDKLGDVLKYLNVEVIGVGELDGFDFDEVGVLVGFVGSLEGLSESLFGVERVVLVNLKTSDEVDKFTGDVKVVLTGDVDGDLVFELVKSGCGVKIVKSKKVIDEVLGVLFVAPNDFFRVDMRVGLVKEVYEVEGSDKLFKCVVSFGDGGERVIYSGVRGIVEADDLVGKKLVYVTNLIPRKMPGGYSYGMLLACGGDKFAFIVPDDDVEEGCRLG